MFTVSETEGRIVVKLEGEVTVRHAGELAAGIAQAVDGDLPVVVETAGLEDVDTSVLQLLCSLRKTVALLAFREPSTVFLAAVERCGLRRELLSGFPEGA